MAKASGKAILERVKKKQAQEAKANVTFRLNEPLMERFRARCKQQEVSMAAILEELIEDYLG
jgi:uncharacterized protein (DUF4415 family)